MTTDRLSRFAPLLLGLALVLGAAGPAQAQSNPVPDAGPVLPCATCGKVIGVEARREAGGVTGVGALLGGALGAMIGREMSGGDKTPGAVLGAIGGGWLGHRIEREMRGERRVYDVDVRMDDGTLRHLTQEQAVTPGQRVDLRSGVARPLDAVAAPPLPDEVLPRPAPATVPSLPV